MFAPFNYLPPSQLPPPEPPSWRAYWGRPLRNQGRGRELVVVWGRIADAGEGELLYRNELSILFKPWSIWPRVERRH